MAYSSDSAGADLAPAARRLFLPLERVIAVICSLVYALGLREGYVHHISPILHYQGEIDLFPPLSVSLLATVAAAVPATLLPLRAGGPGLLISWLVYLLIFVPSCIVPIHAIDYAANDYFTFIVFLGLNVLALAWMAQRRLDLTGRFLRVGSERLYVAAVGSLAIVISVYVWAVLGIQLDVSDSLEGIYEFREVIFDRIWLERLLFSGYLLQLQSYAILPVLTALALMRRRWGLLFATFLGQYLLYLIMAQKSPVAVFASQVALHFIIGRGTHAVLRVATVLASGVWLVLAIDTLADTPALVFSTVRRIATNNGLLTGYYYDYFSGGDYAYFQQTILAGFSGAIDTTSSYKLTIGSTYAWPGSSANANFWADGFANFGWTGLALMTVLLGVLLAVLNSFVDENHERFAIVALAGVVQVLVNTGLHTTLVSGGMLLAFLLIRLLPVDPGDGHDRTAS